MSMIPTMKKLSLVGCGAGKREESKERPIPAQDIYTSTYFDLKRKYAQQVTDGWYIISAKHGVLSPREEIGYYDASVNDMSAAERRDWGADTAVDLIEILDTEFGDQLEEVHILLGKSYYKPISEPLESVCEKRGIELVFPFEGTSGIGQQMSVLSEAVNTVDA